jgi:hypothetical protein
MPVLTTGGGGAGGAPGAAASAGTVTGEDVVTEAKKFLGDRYVYGAEGPSTFDCSGLAQYSYAQLGIKIPRTSQEQYRFGTPVPGPSWLAAGDLVFTEFTGGEPDHVGIYDGAGNVIQAPHTGDVVRVTPLNQFGANQQYRRMPGLGKPSMAGDLGQAGGFGGGTGAGGLLSWPSDITDFFSTALKDLEETAAFFRAFFQPSTYIRIGAGILGAALTLTGLVLLTLEAKGA